MDIRIALIEDHPQYRQTLKRVIREQDGMELCWSFGTAEAALTMLKTGSESIAPDIVLLDLGLPGIGGMDAIADILSACPKAKVIVLTQSGSEADVLRSIALGAQGYLLKSARAREITEAISNVHTGGATFDPRVALYIVDALRKNTTDETKLDSPLSTRETEVLELLAEGKLRKEVAAELGVAETTVVYHINNIYQKLHVHNAPGAVAKAFGLGILPSRKTKS